LALFRMVRTCSRPTAVFDSGVRIELDAHAGQRAAAHENLSDPGTCIVLRHDAGGRVVHFALSRMLEVSASMKIGASAGSLAVIGLEGKLVGK